MSDYKQTLRRLAVRDNRFVDQVLLDGPRNVETSQLDPKTHGLVRIGALIVLDAAPASFEAAVDSAVRAGASLDEIVGTLIAVMPVAGSARVTAAAPNLALGVGYDLDTALELLQTDPDGRPSPTRRSTR